MFKKLLVLLGVVIGLQSIVLGFYGEENPLPETNMVLAVKHIAQLHNIKNKELFLIRAAEKNDILGVKMWLMAGANINAQEKLYGNTALVVASKYGYTEIVKLLLEAGADVNVKNKDGETALMKASYNGYTEIVKMLIDAGADVNIKDRYGTTALMLASLYGYTEIVELLIKAGANVNIKNSYGGTALRWASANGSTKIVELLKEAGAK